MHIMKAPQNLQVAFFIDCLALWHVLMVHNTTGVNKKKSALLLDCRKPVVLLEALVISDASIPITSDDSLYEVWAMVCKTMFEAVVPLPDLSLGYVIIAKGLQNLVWFKLEYHQVFGKT